MPDNHDQLHVAIASMRAIDRLLQQIADALPQSATAADAELLETLKAESKAIHGRIQRVSKQIIDIEKPLTAAAE